MYIYAYIVHWIYARYQNSFVQSRVIRTVSYSHVSLEHLVTCIKIASYSHVTGIVLQSRVTRNGFVHSVFLEQFRTFSVPRTVLYIQCSQNSFVKSVFHGRFFLQARVTRTVSYSHVLLEQFHSVKQYQNSFIQSNIIRTVTYSYMLLEQFLDVTEVDSKTMLFRKQNFAIFDLPKIGYLLYKAGFIEL